MRKTWIWVLFGALMLAFLLPWSTHAHAVPVQSSPADGAVLREAPDWVTVKFSYELNPQGSSLVVYDRRGQKVDVGDCGFASVDPSRKTLITSLNENLPPGKYNIYWTSVTESDDLHDGHIVTGQLEFYISPPPWLVFIRGMGITLAIGVAFGGWMGFGLTQKQLRQLKKESTTTKDEQS